MKYFATSVLAWLFLTIPTAAIFGFSTHNSDCVRTNDRTIAAVGAPITFTAGWTNLEIESLRGFYFVEQIAPGLHVDTISVTIDGSPVPTFTEEIGAPNDVYDGFAPYRWILETPPDFPEDQPLPRNATLEIVYTISSDVEGTFNLSEFNWVGIYPGAAEGERAAFGHSDDQDAVTVTFAFVCEQDYDFDGDVDGSDLAELAGSLPTYSDVAAFAQDFGRANCPAGSGQ